MHPSRLGAEGCDTTNSGFDGPGCSILNCGQRFVLDQFAGAAHAAPTNLRGSAKHIAQRNHPYYTFCTTTARNARLTKKPPSAIVLAFPPIRTIQNPRRNLQSRSNKLATFSSGLGWLILPKTGAQNKAQPPAFLPRGVQGA